VAVLRINFVKKGEHERRMAKENIKYIENRLGKNGEKIHRTLFTTTGTLTRLQAYELIDQAEEGSTFFRIKICPDPVKEDTDKDLLLREITEKTMDLEEKIGKPLTWVAAIHDDHTDKRHVHVLAVTKARLLPAKVLIQQATHSSLEQRRELDQAREQERQKGLEWEREPSR
jgi:hypothetical protein